MIFYLPFQIFNFYILSLVIMSGTCCTVVIISLFLRAMFFRRIPPPADITENKSSENYVFSADKHVGYGLL